MLWLSVISDNLEGFEDVSCFESNSLAGIPYSSIGLANYENLKRPYLFIEAGSEKW